MNKETFVEALLEKGIQLNEKQQWQFQRYFEVLVEWNEKMNLTALTSEEDVYLKHFYDSISACFYYSFKEGQNIIDVGAGAGFPSLPIKIIHPGLNVHIVDSLNKRIGFLEHLANELELENVKFYHDRAELFGKNANHREKYDLVMARAVARMSVLSELCLPLVKVGGDFVALKGASSQEELSEGLFAIETLGGRVIDSFQFELPEEKSDRHIVIIKKERKTAKKYPRKPGTPNKQPLIK
ncbi:16S rRNA methyltransferase [Alkalihalobacillus alcalophilus ATCC 27647 = CGMCC 1.3604]|uniref:Ribosomal RNA small subunit methyltransferase G n=1 Tax=Alkalihalobacillus alcalophilus ATCC 27647 = CGMCC 1.3604 TaxID=1218173 RepID=A0A094WK45_ALKAL|nr:16S rRNA (guanine(527)-N(7))-methyltransferase RsmG [Alkalihalobacillus alcalophilus]KGA96308.1 16S rRNA methyltransferase [Alkalihalobacillus alcalophilus ATCC 27647 = CGMCC 1.3604]MED1560349.1 16S rRNA (guanine(527)-N(7))-methyltransferase RsmG [Alkalihalobacillus alcalophilus]THG89957.1 16S rRNA methyltransferase [Alkalihalobacillus alcalophilus ATCC 27647 = CGMCC 1.3604]